jgi:hypothetical protein
MYKRYTEKQVRYDDKVSFTTNIKRFCRYRNIDTIKLDGGRTTFYSDSSNSNRNWSAKFEITLDQPIIERNYKQDREKYVLNFHQHDQNQPITYAFKQISTEIELDNRKIKKGEVEKSVTYVNSKIEIELDNRKIKKGEVEKSVTYVNSKTVLQALQAYNRRRKNWVSHSLRNQKYLKTPMTETTKMLSALYTEISDQHSEKLVYGYTRALEQSCNQVIALGIFVNLIASFLLLNFPSNQLTQYTYDPLIKTEEEVANNAHSTCHIL